jgi:hypothetical protein
MFAGHQEQLQLASCELDDQDESQDLTFEQPVEIDDELSSESGLFALAFIITCVYVCSGILSNGL